MEEQVGRSRSSFTGAAYRLMIVANYQCSILDSHAQSQYSDSILFAWKMSCQQAYNYLELQHKSFVDYSTKSGLIGIVVNCFSFIHLCTLQTYAITETEILTEY